MGRRPFSQSSHPNLSAAAVAALALLCVAAGVAGAAKLTPVGRHTPVAVGIDGTVYRYFALTNDEPLRVDIEGPAVFDAIIRWRFEADAESAVDVVIETTVDGTDVVRHVLHMRPGGGTYADIEDASPGRSERIRFDVPSGSHEIAVRLISPEGVADVNPLSKELDVLPWRFDWDGSLRMTYDSNIYRYSDEDVEDFADGERFERYPHDTTDELRLDPAVNIAFVREAPGSRTTEFSAGAAFFLATSNGDKSFAKLSAKYTETLERLARVSVGYAAIPAYHLKYVWDADAPSTAATDYRSCDFRKHSLRVDLGTAGQLPVELTGWWRYDDYGYGPDFVEYDTWSNTFGARLTARPRQGIRLDGQYAYRRSLSRGYDEIGEGKRTSDDSDTTYDQNEYELIARWEVGRVHDMPVVLRARGKYIQRYYLSENLNDEYHAGRDDTLWIAGARIELELTDSTSLVCAYEHRARTSESDIVPTIGDTKDYDADRFSVQFVVEGGRFLD